VPCDRASFSDFVAFASYLLGVELTTEFPPGPFPYGVTTPAAGIDARTLLKMIANDLGGSVRIGKALPASYSPQPAFRTWSSSRAMAYRLNRNALIELLGGDKVDPDPEAREEASREAKASEVIASFQNQMRNSGPFINVGALCGKITVSELLEGLSYIAGYRLRLDSPEHDFGMATFASPSCGEVGLPGLLRWIASWLNSPIKVGDAVARLPLEALPSWVASASPRGVYLFQTREALISVLKGETVSPDPRWTELFQAEWEEFEQERLEMEEEGLEMKREGLEMVMETDE